MLTIEWKRLLRDFLIIVAVLLILILAIDRTDRADILAPIMQIFLLMFTAYLGWSIFDRERQEGALEYLFSLPISRTHLFFVKVIPRLVIILLLVGVFNLISALQKLPFLVLTDFQFSLLLISIFLSSIVFSISIKNFLIAFFLTTLGTAGLFQLIRYLDVIMAEASLGLQTFISLLPFPILFFFLMKQWDMRPLLRFNLRLASSLIILSAVVVGVTLLITHRDQQSIFPASGRTTIHTTENRALIKVKKKVKYRFNHSMLGLFEVNGKVYADIGSRKNGRSHLVLLNPRTGTYRSIFKSDKWWYHEDIFNRPVLNGKVYFLLTHFHFRNHHQILEVSGDKARIIPIESQYLYKHFCRLAGATEQPLQFVLFQRPNPRMHEVMTDVVLVKEDGHAKVLFEARAVATWKNRLLRFTKGKMELYELGEGVSKVFEKEGKIQKVQSARILQGNFIQKNVLVHVGGQYFIFNMENLAMDKVKISSMPYFYYDTDDGVRMVWVKEDEISVSSWEAGRLIVENIWYTKIKPINVTPTKKFRRFEVYPAGVQVWNPKQHEVFFFAEKKKEVGISGGL